MSRFNEPLVPRPFVAVLGCGPAGLVAAHAARMAGAEIRIISDRPTPSPIYGAQYLHEPIPGINYSPPVRVKYTLQGSADDYRDKVYGPQWVGPVSPEDLDEEHDAWDLRETYKVLWDQYKDCLVSLTITPRHIQDIRDNHDLTVSTVPADSLCPGWNVERIDKDPGNWPGAHQFRERWIWAAGEAPEQGITIPYKCPVDTVVCNGESSPAWYRMSNIYGRTTVEWPGALPYVPIKTAARVRKPLMTNCDCWLDKKYMRAGRYGAWDKSQLVHDAFNAVYERVSEWSQT